jgi:hypothetical protein
MSDELMINDHDDNPMRVADLPDPTERALFGYGHFPYDIKHRKVITVPGREWPYTPDTCHTDEHAGEWLNPYVLVCTGCGMDFT